jgi:hypothetical protein
MVKATKGEEVSLSELARRAGLHRETVREKLASKGVKPQHEGARKKLYDADEALAALQGGDERSGLRKAQTIKTAVEANRAKLKLERERGELVSVADARSDLQEVVKRIHQHFTVTSPAVLAPQLRGRNVSQIEAALRRDAEQFFRDLRAEFETYLNAED